MGPQRQRARSVGSRAAERSLPADRHVGALAAPRAVFLDVGVVRPEPNRRHGYHDRRYGDTSDADHRHDADAGRKQRNGLRGDRDGIAAAGERANDHDARQMPLWRQIRAQDARKRPRRSRCQCVRLGTAAAMDCRLRFGCGCWREFWPRWVFGLPALDRQGGRSDHAERVEFFGGEQAIGNKIGACLGDEVRSFFMGWPLAEQALLHDRLKVERLSSAVGGS